MHPIDHVVIMYQLSDSGRYGRPEVYETSGNTASLTMPSVVIDWGRVIDPTTPVD